MILIIDNYDSFTYNLYQLIEELGFHCLVVRNDEITLQEIKILNPSHIIISPGPGRPEDAGISLEIIQTLSGKFPILGVCLGHQAISLAFGGKVVLAPLAYHGKCSTISHDEKGLFKSIRSDIKVTRYHSLIVSDLPDCLEVTCQTSEGVIMGIRHKSLPLEGVQFHPESYATEEGKKMLENFLGQVG